MSMGSIDVPADWPAPRLCHLVKWTHFDGYGFNLHAEKNKAGQFIGKVDANSPAEAAGLRSGDRIIEVNNVNIANENHKQVVERIKAVPNETKLLVLDAAADTFYKERKIVVKNSQSNVVYKKTPAEDEEENESPAADEVGTGINNNKNEVEEEASERLSQKSNKTGSGSHSSTPCGERKENEGSVHSVEGERPISNSSFAHSPSPQNSPKSDKQEFQPNVSTASTESPQPSPKQSPQPSPEPSTESPEPSTASPKPSPKPSPQTSVNEAETAEATSNGTASMNGSPVSSPTNTKPANGQDKLNLNMTAQEMRALLAERNKKKIDPRKDPMDLRQKYKIIQSM